MNDDRREERWRGKRDREEGDRERKGRRGGERLLSIVILGCLKYPGYDYGSSYCGLFMLAALNKSISIKANNLRFRSDSIIEYTS
jgi:hypothetical protein